MKYKVGDTLKIRDSDTIVTIQEVILELGEYVIGNTWDYRDRGKPDRELPKYAYPLGSAISIKEQYLEDFVQQYRKGDTVWYLDRTPKIQKGVIKQKYGSIENPYYCIVDQPAMFTLYEHQLHATKEALLAAIDPPLHNFTVGQTVWYANNLVDRLCVQKGIFCSCEDEAVTVGIGGDYAVQTFVHIDCVFDNPEDAVIKALELKQW